MESPTIFFAFLLVFSACFYFAPTLAEPPWPDWIVDPNGKNKTTIRELVRQCLLQADDRVTFDILIDIASDPLKSPFFIGFDRKDAYLGKFVEGRYFTSDPFLVHEHISLFIAQLEMQMNPEKLFIGIVDSNTTYYLDTSAASGLGDLTTSTTTAANHNITTTTDAMSKTVGGILNASIRFGNEIAALLAEAAGIKPSVVSDEVWPNANVSIRLARMTRKVLDGRARGFKILLPETKSKRANFTIVITDGTRETPPYLYPPSASTLVLDLGGYWSACCLIENNILARSNIFMLDYPQDLNQLILTSRFLMCQAIGGLNRP